MNRGWLLLLIVVPFLVVLIYMLALIMNLSIIREDKTIEKKQKQETQTS